MDGYLTYEYSPTMQVPGAASRVAHALHTAQRSGPSVNVAAQQEHVAEMTRRQQQREISGDMTYVRFGGLGADGSVGGTGTAITLASVGVGILVGGLAVWLLMR